MLKGSIVAIVTPFKNGGVDYKKFNELVKWHIDSGTNGIVPCGTTGETPTLSEQEHMQVMDECIQTAKGKVPVIPGTGSNCTNEAVRLTKHAAKSGADGVLVVSPYYNRPTQEGLYRHFKAVSECANIPIILYNIAGRTGVNIETDTIVRLVRDCKNIVGVKEASGSLDQMQAVRISTPKEFVLLSGDDSLTLPVLSIGGVGVISVVANIVPKDVVKLINAFNAGNIEEARQIHFKLFPLIKAMFIESNPTPVKKAVELLKLASGEVRLPLCEVSKISAEKIQKAMMEYGLLN